MTEEKEGMEILKFLYRNRKYLVLTSVFAGLVALIFTAFITPKYEAIATVFPPGFNSSDRMLENPQFGYNIEADRLIQIGESFNLKDSLIKKFDLVSYYEIDQSDPDWKSTLLRKYDSDINVSRTKYMSVQISVMNENPEKAAEIANEIVLLLGRFWEHLFKNNMLKSLDYAQHMYLKKQSEVSGILDSIHIIRSKNSDESLEKLHEQMLIKEKEVESNLNQMADLRSSSNFYNYENQLEIISEELLKINRVIEMEQAVTEAMKDAKFDEDTSYALSMGRYKGAITHREYLNKQMQELKKNGRVYDQLSVNLETSMEQYHEVKTNYENLLYSFEPLVKSVDLEFLESRYTSERNALNELKKKFEIAHRYYNEPLPNLFVIDSARPVYKKASPSYIINSLLSTIGVFVLTVFFLLFQKSFGEISKGISS